jgi:hypothetical protein
MTLRIHLDGRASSNVDVPANCVKPLPLLQTPSGALSFDGEFAFWRREQATKNPRRADAVLGVASLRGRGVSFLDYSPPCCGFNNKIGLEPKLCRSPWEDNHRLFCGHSWDD